MRAITSEGPPAANGTMMVTWRDGKVSACAPKVPSNVNSAIARASPLIIVSPQHLFRGDFITDRPAREWHGGAWRPQRPALHRRNE
jgi:hypothetical protein